MRAGTGKLWAARGILDLDTETSMGPLMTVTPSLQFRSPRSPDDLRTRLAKLTDRAIRLAIPRFDDSKASNSDADQATADRVRAELVRRAIAQRVASMLTVGDIEAPKLAPISPSELVEEQAMEEIIVRIEWVDRAQPPNDRPADLEPVNRPALTVGSAQPPAGPPELIPQTPALAIQPPDDREEELAGAMDAYQHQQERMKRTLEDQQLLIRRLRRAVLEQIQRLQRLDATRRRSGTVQSMRRL